MDIGNAFDPCVLTALGLMAGACASGVAFAVTEARRAWHATPGTGGGHE